MKPILFDRYNTPWYLNVHYGGETDIGVAIYSFDRIAGRNASARDAWTLVPHYRCDQLRARCVFRSRGIGSAP